MSIRRVVPDITTDCPAETREFYVSLLGFDVAMDLGWVVTLASPSNPTAQLIIVHRDGSTPPHPDISVEVDDVEAVYRDAVQRGLQIPYPLRDESWGVRRFFVVDPNGLLVNVVSHRRT
ncbi:MAG: VOC family protein [Chloroflexi bacterium]|nr:VOC family protein [Chloroflexota bacterium]